MTTANSSIAAIFAAVTGNYLNKDSINKVASVSATASAIDNSQDSKQNTSDDDNVVNVSVKHNKEFNSDDDNNQPIKDKMDLNESACNTTPSSDNKSDSNQLNNNMKENHEDIKKQLIKFRLKPETDNTEKLKFETCSSSSLEKNNDTIKLLQSDEEKLKSGTMENDMKAKINSIMDFAAKIRENTKTPTSSSSSITITDSKIKVSPEFATATSSSSENSPNPSVSNSFFYPPVTVTTNYQLQEIQEAAIKALTSNSKINTVTNNNSKGLDLALNKIELSGSNSNGDDNGNSGITNDMDPMDLSSSSAMNINPLTIGESHVIPVDPNTILTNLNSSIDQGLVTPAVKRRKRSNWNVETEKAFVKYWRQYYTELKKSKRTSVVYQKIADELNKFGLSLTCRDVQVKTHNMTQKYRHERRLIYQSDGKPSSWPVYDEVHELIGHLYKDDAKPETNKDESVQSNGCIAGPSSPKTPKVETGIPQLDTSGQHGSSSPKLSKMETGIPQLDTLGQFGKFGALGQFGPLGQFAPFNQFGPLGSYDNLHIKREEEEEYVMDNDINQPSAQDNLTTPSDYASESRSQSPISHNHNTTTNVSGINNNCDYPATAAGAATTTTAAIASTSTPSTATSAGPSRTNCNASTSRNYHRSKLDGGSFLKLKRTRKRNFNVEILNEIKKLNKDAREDSQCSNKLLSEANAIEKKKLSIIEEYVRRSLQIQEKMLEIQIQRRNFL